jgi:hypothetical protein
MAKPAASIVVNGHKYVLAPDAAPVASGDASSAVTEPIVAVCACGHAFRYGRAQSLIDANALGLCGLKGRTTHANA